MRRGIGVQRQMGCRAPSAALIKQNEIVPVRVKHAQEFGGQARARADMQENQGQAIRIAATLPVQGVAVADREIAGLAGRGFSEKGRHRAEVTSRAPTKLLDCASVEILFLPVCIRFKLLRNA